MKTCTFCKQESSDEVEECPFCGHAVVGQEPAEHNSAARLTMKPGALFGIGILLVFLGLFFNALFPPLGLLVRLLGLGFYLAGCWKYTNNKGWNGWLGVFLGLTMIGLLVMVLLEDKTRQPKQPDSSKV